MSETGAHDQPRDFALPLGAGIVQVFAGALMFAAGAAAAWSWTALACGAALVVGAWLISFDPPAEARQAVLTAAAISTVLLGLALVYFTHRAHDLPGVLPGHDGDSRHYRVTEGFASLALAGAAFLSALPRALRRG